MNALIVLGGDMPGKALLESCCALAHAMDLDAETALLSALGRQIERLRTENS